MAEHWLRTSKDPKTLTCDDLGAAIALGAAYMGQGYFRVPDQATLRRFLEASDLPLEKLEAGERAHQQAQEKTRLSKKQRRFLYAGLLSRSEYNPVYPPLF